MNLLVALVIVLCLVCSEFQQGSPTQDLSIRLCLIGLTTCLVPGLAIFQTFFVTREGTPIEPQAREGVIQRLTACHTAVWFAASLAIIVSLRWHEVVRNNWGLGDLILIDELLILTPVILSMLASWAVFYEIDNRWREPPKSSRDSLVCDLDAKPHSRWQFVTLRFQLQIVAVLVPLAVAITFRDTRDLLSTANRSTVIAACMAMMGGGWLVGALLMRLVWSSKPVAPEISRKMSGELEARGVRVGSIRNWQTGSQIINACVMGLTRFDRRVLLSDRLLQEFPEKEILAVVRHEAGHVSLRHARHRILFCLAPIAALVLAGLLTNGSPLFVEALTERIGVPAVWGFVVFVVLLLAYLRVVLPWLSHMMEYEADLYASCEVTGDRSDYKLTFSERKAGEMSEALLRLAAYHLSQFERGTLFHPSIRSRVESLASLPADFCAASTFRRLQIKRWCWLAISFAGMTAGCSMLMWLV